MLQALQNLAKATENTEPVSDWQEAAALIRAKSDAHLLTS